MDLIIRDIDPMIVKKIEELAFKSGYKSRESFLRKRLEQIATLVITEEIHDKYSQVVNLLMSVVKDNTREIKKLNELLQLSK